MQATTLRIVAAAAAAGSAILYYLIGFSVLFIGESTSGENDILGFGLTVGTVFAVLAVVVLLFRRRWVLGIVAALDVAVIIGYFAVAGVRLPPFELWGLTIKALQVIVLVAVGRLIARAPGQAAVGRGASPA